MALTDAHIHLATSVKKIVENALNDFTTTNSVVGVVTEDPNAFSANVKINNEVFECTLPEHLHSWIQKDDIVIIQDLFNNGQKKVITGKTGQLQKTPSLVFYDSSKDRLTSGVDGLFDEKGNKQDIMGTVGN